MHWCQNDQQKDQERVKRFSETSTLLYIPVNITLHIRSPGLSHLEAFVFMCVHACTHTHTHTHTLSLSESVPYFKAIRSLNQRSTVFS